MPGNSSAQDSALLMLHALTQSHDRPLTLGTWATGFLQPLTSRHSGRRRRSATSLTSCWSTPADDHHDDGNDNDDGDGDGDDDQPQERRRGGIKQQLLVGGAVLMLVLLAGIGCAGLPDPQPKAGLLLFDEKKQHRMATDVSQQKQQQAEEDPCAVEDGENVSRCAGMWRWRRQHSRVAYLRTLV